MNTQTIAIQRAVALLGAAGAKYKIIAADGAEFGDLVVATEPVTKPRKMNKEFAWGERTAYAKAFIEKMNPGDVLIVPYGPYGRPMAGIVACTASDMWGKGSNVTVSKEDSVEILRVL